MVMGVAVVLKSGLSWFSCLVLGIDSIVVASSTLLLDVFMEVDVVLSSFCEFGCSIAVVLIADVV